MRKFFLIVPALLAAGIIVDASTAAQARVQNFMNSPGYQRQLAESRKAYADEVAAQSAPHVTYRATRKKKTTAPKQ